MYQSLSRQIDIVSNKLDKNYNDSRISLSQIMKQFKLFKGLVERLEIAADNSGTLTDLSMHKEADEKFLKLKRLLANIDEGSMPSRKFETPNSERSSAGS